MVDLANELLATLPVLRNPIRNLLEISGPTFPAVRPTDSSTVKTRYSPLRSLLAPKDLRASLEASNELKGDFRGE